MKARLAAQKKIPETLRVIHAKMERNGMKPSQNGNGFKEGRERKT